MRQACAESGSGSVRGDSSMREWPCGRAGVRVSEGKRGSEKGLNEEKPAHAGITCTHRASETKKRSRRMAVLTR